MRHSLALAIGICLVGASAVAWTHAQQAPPAPPSAAALDDALKEIRADLQNSRADTIAKNVSLTTAQAAQFWPVFENYQREQNAIMDEQLKTVQWFIENFEKADDAAALRLMNAHFERDTKMNALRQHWLSEFQKVIGTKVAVRVMQVQPAVVPGAPGLRLHADPAWRADGTVDLRTTIEGWTMRPCFGLSKRACRRCCRRNTRTRTRTSSPCHGIGGTEVRPRRPGRVGRDLADLLRPGDGRRAAAQGALLQPGAADEIAADPDRYARWRRNLPRGHDGGRTARRTLAANPVGSRRL